MTVINQIYLVTLTYGHLTQASFLQKNPILQKKIDIFNVEIGQCRQTLDIILGTKVAQF